MYIYEKLSIIMKYVESYLNIFFIFEVHSDTITLFREDPERKF
jgi:hypothetical protein